MVANNYQNDGLQNTEVVELMILGFIGKLLDWWNNCLTEESKEDIKHDVQKDENENPIFDEHIGRGVPDGVNTLIYTIMKHFKEKFINGLPTLFGQKVKETLASPLGVIDYDNLTYGDISSTLQNEGMKMCRDLKIQSQANKSKAKYEIGNFCTQYGLPLVIPKRKSKHRGKEPSEKSHRKKTASRYYRKQKFKTDDFYKKGKSKSTGKFIPKTSRKCFKCGKRGHFQKECKAKAKSLINTLISDQTSKEEIFKLLELDRLDSESSNSSSNEEKHQLYKSSSEPSRVSSSSSSGIDEIPACKDSCCRNKTISVLSKQEELLLDLIEQTKDPVTKAQKLSEFHKTLVKEEYIQT
ncbi:uncharacterized protein LOC115990332 [Quercus lobata]|uniref:uncharacterized protein LOC115990332 n=1 Tax=Quercus lobata TaxID=97700 RepID=UPI001248CF23|nr:uncharacterized protein LOC115990332 [Quercus lobata]